jgi:4a-hydroxytetrahydrobiopterin dehydratase
MPRFPPGWSVTPDGARVGIQVRAPDFLSALDLFAELGRIAEELEHHPDLHLERYREVRIESYSHDVGRLTSRDETLVARMDAVLRARGLRP